MRTQKCVILTVALVVGIFGVSLSAFEDEAQKASTPSPASAPRTRTYYIAAENTTWNYAPTGKDQMTGKPVPAPWGKQVVYKKVRYFEYTDDSFTQKKPQPTWLGILGPIIRGVEGDTAVERRIPLAEQCHQVKRNELIQEDKESKRKNQI